MGFCFRKEHLALFIFQEVSSDSADRMNTWCSSRFSSLRIENWDGEFTVFQPASGKTHFLNEMGLRILTILNQSPATLEIVCKALSEYFSLQPDKDFTGQIAKTLYRFEALGLITRMKERV